MWTLFIENFAIDRSRNDVVETEKIFQPRKKGPHDADRRVVTPVDIMRVRTVLNIIPHPAMVTSTSPCCGVKLRGRG